MIDQEGQKPFIILVDTILEMTAQNPTSNTKVLEDKINELVMDLYDLTKDEKEIIRTSTQ